jgi:hypothetical protein
VPVAVPAPPGILVVAARGVPVAEPSVAERAAVASILLVEPVTVTVVVAVAAAAAADVAVAVAASSIPAAVLPTQPANMVQPVYHAEKRYTHLHSLLLRLLLIWVK